MTEISEAAKERRRQLGTEYPEDSYDTIFARYIQQVSDAAKVADAALQREGFARYEDCRVRLSPFILPDPVDPLEDVFREGGFIGEPKAVARCVREELAKRGLEIRPVQP